MGSFNLSCAISGLPCTPGDPVYAMLLTHNGNGSSRDVYSNDLWVPRTPAMLGTYDDYGRVAFSDDRAEQTLQRVACIMLDLESEERGGTPARGGIVRHGMRLAGYLEAIEEDNLVVTCSADGAIREMNDRFAAEYGREPEPAPAIGPIPTVASVVAVLERGGLRANDTGPCFHVSEYECGEVVVSCASWGSLKIEDVAAVVGTEYAAIVARGRGYDDGSVVRVFPKPMAEGWVGPGPGWDRQEPRPVTLCVVRADVWSALIGHPISRWDSEDGYRLDDYVLAEEEFRRISLGFDDGRQDSDLEPLHRRLLARGAIQNILWEKRSLVAAHLGMSSTCGGSGAPGITGWASHHETWLDLLARKDAPALETADDVGRRFAEGCMVYDHISRMHLRVMPSQYAGQVESWADHAALLRAFSEIASAEKRKADEDQ